MNDYQKALMVLTDYFRSYVDNKGIVVHEIRITEEYLQAKEVLKEAVKEIDKYKKSFEDERWK